MQKRPRSISVTPEDSAGTEKGIGETDKERRELERRTKKEGNWRDGQRQNGIGCNGFESLDSVKNAHS